MGKPALVVILGILNALLAVGLLRARSASEAKSIQEPSAAAPAIAERASTRSSNIPKPQNNGEKPTAFASVYSIRPAEFAANLRRAGCPEETVRDILVAEVGRKYRGREEDLRPTPGDHLPWGWSAKTHEAKIIERRQQAAAMAREKEGLLRTALGYDVNMPMPKYAMTVSDQAFQKQLEQLPLEKRQAAHLANEQYWILVEQLRGRTQGFWQREDIEELERLKAERQQSLDALQEGN